MFLNVLFNPKKSDLLILKNFKIKNCLLHLHGMWMPTTLIGYLIAKKYNIPYIFSPHGGTMPFAMRYHGFRKKLALFFYQRQIIENSNLIIVASNLEASSIVCNFKNENIKIIPHGIKIPVKKYDDLLKKYTYQRKCLFLGRINKTKGIYELLKSWANVRPPGWELVIAGNTIDKNYLNSLKKLVKEENIKFIGAVSGDEKKMVFLNSELFISPTKTENYGISIAEAMSYGLPIITTKAAPWKIIEEQALGWWIDQDQDSLNIALKQATRMNRRELQDMGKRSFKFASNKLSLEKTKLIYLKEYQNLFRKTALK